KNSGSANLHKFNFSDDLTVHICTDSHLQRTGEAGLQPVNPNRSTDASPAWRFVAGERAAGVVSRPPSAPHDADRYQRQTSSRIADSQRSLVPFGNLDPKTRPSMHTAPQAFGNRPRWPAGGRSPRRACGAGGTFSSPRSGHTQRQESFACLASLAPRLAGGGGCASL